jgi:cytochrome c biogenesis protein ResB
MAIVLIILSVLFAIGGYFLKQRLFKGWEQRRIGAIDGLFSARGLLAFLLYALYHVAWFMLTGMSLIMGLVYLVR